MITLNQIPKIFKLSPHQPVTDFKLYKKKRANSFYRTTRHCIRKAKRLFHNTSNFLKTNLLFT